MGGLTHCFFKPVLTGFLNHMVIIKFDVTSFVTKLKGEARLLSAQYQLAFLITW
jgi:hypothetical protein